MHDLDRMTLETGYGEYEMNEYGHEFEGSHGEGEYESYGESYGESPFSEAEEMELAAELLSVSNEAELEQFIGNLFKRASKAVGGFLKSPVGQQLGGIVKGAAKQGLPMLGSALGNMVLPGVGGMIGGQLASAAGNMLGLELEGLSQEDQEFETAKQLVRFAGAAASNAAQAPANAAPQQIAQNAAVAAAQQYAPGLLRPPLPASAAQPATAQGKGRHRCTHPRKGTWMRRGNTIILFGA